MRLLEESFPLLVGLAPVQWDTAAVQRMAAAFEPYYTRGQRYAFISVQPVGSLTPGARERKLLMDWVDSPRVRRHAGELCVSAAAVIEGSLMRGAFTALLWLWKPPFPLEPVATPAHGIEYCVSQLVAADVIAPAQASTVQARATRELALALGKARAQR